MKKRLAIRTLILCLFVGFCYYINLPDYQLFNSMSFSSGNERDTHLKVVVYKYWGIDETVSKIEAEHNGINGTPTILEINLYRTAWLIRYGEQPFRTVIIEYN